MEEDQFADFDGEHGVWTPMRTLPFNLPGDPALAVPIALLNGLPAGMQIIGKIFGEAQICRIAHAFEQATDSAALRPPEPLRLAA